MRCSKEPSYSITSSARLASGVKLDIGNPVALAPAQAGLFRDYRRKISANSIDGS
jgi:hypothetical protein